MGSQLSDKNNHLCVSLTRKGVKSIKIFSYKY